MPTQNPHEPFAIAPGTVVDGRYKVVRGIGQGGNGMVYEVEHARTGRKLALKALLDETGFARLEQEARAASLMKNGHTARIVDMEAGGPAGAYMVMELLEGQSLRALLDDAGQLPFELTINIAMQVCECLHEAHGLGIIHRDLKPENVFLCASPWPGQYDVKVLDFGVMKIAEGGGAIPKSSLTRTGSTVGTPYYMSLEQLRNSSAVDARADVYSLGVVLYECLSGRKPFQADTIGDLVYALCSGPPTQLSRLRPDVPAEMADVVMRTLSASRDERPASMRDLALSLLPHSNQAFALWVKVDGKQPALAAGAPARKAPPVAPTPARPPAPRPGSTPGLGPETQQGFGEAKPAPAESEPAAARRDTPTEMYVKSLHDTPLLDNIADLDGLDGERGEGAASGLLGDRDTPTRAYIVDAMPGARVPSTMDEDHPELATVDLRGGVDLAHGPAPALPTPSEVGKTTIPLSGFLRQLQPPPAIDVLTPPSSTAPQPRWQERLDRVLIRIGRASEVQMQRFHEAPQNTQIIVMIVAGTLAILLLGFVLFLSVH
jgi:serine/threonine-protein kinase